MKKFLSSKDVDILVESEYKCEEISIYLPATKS